ncbi:gamma carbonic anhydrase family protein [Nocardioides baekrokdamisoli]|nr:gamma carbonic anhydrase family protein [Nocardioides baekrokdamisoli]
MPMFEFEGKRPQVHPEAFIAPTATLIGDVTVEKGASIWYGVVLRADICTIIVREGANIQDNSVVHGGPEAVVEIGAHSTVAHSCVMHGKRLGEKSILANNSVMLDDSVIGDGTMVAASSMIGPGGSIPDHVLAAGAPAQVKKPIAGTPAEFWVQVNGDYYADLARRHANGVREV